MSSRGAVGDVVISALAGQDAVDCHGAKAPRNDILRRYIIRPMRGQYCVYIITNRHNTTLYTGVTNDLKRRVYEHKSRASIGFSNKYNLFKLVYYEMVEDINSAISREKQLKAGPRRRKIDLINGMNPDWKDLYGEIV